MTDAEYAILAFLSFFCLAGSAAALIAAVKRDDMDKQDIAMFVLNFVVFAAITWDWFIR